MKDHVLSKNYLKNISDVIRKTNIFAFFEVPKLIKKLSITFQ